MLPESIIKEIFYTLEKLPSMRKIVKQIGKYRITANIFDHWQGHVVLRIEIRIYGDKDEN